MVKQIALVDANSFYARCERIYDPSLEGRPVIVLTNNDGCAIARNEQAKALGIKMGDPWFRIRHLEKEAGLVAFSSNYPMYAHVSNRFMDTLAEWSPDQEIYSIDESFLDLTGMPGRQVTRGLAIRRQVYKEVGLIVCVGIGATKTLAKLANHIAKKQAQFEGVVDLNSWEPHHMTQTFSLLSVREVWGVGEQLEARLAEYGICSVMDLKLADPEYIRQQFSVVLARTVRELNGVACLELEDVRPDKKQIMSSRSFGQPVTELQGLSEAIATFINRACEKLRAQGSYAGVVHIHISTNRFNTDPKERYAKPATLRLPAPTDDTGKLNQAAQWMLKKIYRPGFKYSSAGIMLDDISPAGSGQSDMFGYQPTVSKRDKLMTAVDEINGRLGKNTVRVGVTAGKKEWTMKQERKSPSYTSKVSDIPRAK